MGFNSALKGLRHGVEHFPLRSINLFIWNKEELPAEWKESIIVPMYKKGDNTECSNYRGTSLLSTMYRSLFNVLLSRLIPYAQAIIGVISIDFDLTGQILEEIGKTTRYSSS